MNRIERSALLPYSAAELYEMVNDVERYPEFVPGCVSTEVLRREENICEARLDLAAAGLRYSFTTRNRLHPQERIEMDLLKGPFRRLQGSWRFEPVSENSCQVHFEMVFQPSIGPLGFLLKRFSDTVGDKVLQAMGKRAEHLYG